MVPPVSGSGAGGWAAATSGEIVERLKAGRSRGRNKISIGAVADARSDALPDEEGLAPASTVDDGPLSSALTAPISESDVRGLGDGKLCNVPHFGQGGLDATEEVGRTCGAEALYQCQLCKR